jgi:DNA-binding NarL/FixJ family response regulator
MSAKTRLLIADDHPVVRAGVRRVLEEPDDFEVVGEATDGLEAVALVQRLQPDLVILDLRMPKLDGVDATEQIRRAQRRTQVLILTTFQTEADVLRAVAAGAVGYLLKDAPPEELVAAVRRAAQGKTVFTAEVVSHLMNSARGGVRAGTALTPREIEVLAQVARGESNAEIARHLKVSEATVKTHLLHAFDKLGVKDRTAAVTAALERGILRLGG